MLKHPKRSKLSKYWDLNPETIFLNHGSFGACPKEVLDHQFKLRTELESDPVHFFDITSKQLWAESIQTLADFINADKEGMVFVPNATSGVNTVLRALSLKSGDEILVPDHTYSKSERFTLSFTVSKGVSASFMLPFLPKLILIWPLTKFALASFKSIVMPLLTSSHSSFQKLMMTVPVSSPTRPSQIIVPLSIARGSSKLKTLTGIFTRPVLGVNSSTFKLSTYLRDKRGRYNASLSP